MKVIYTPTPEDKRIPVIGYCLICNSYATAFKDELETVGKFSNTEGYFPCIVCFKSNVKSSFHFHLNSSDTGKNYIKRSEELLAAQSLNKGN